MATAGYYIAEAHVMRKLHKEKMKRMEEEAAKRSGENDVVLAVKRSSTSIGCFGMFKKIHPNSNVAAPDQTIVTAQGVNNWNSKGL